MRKQKIKKALVLLLSLSMIFQLLPVDANADETVPIQTKMYYVGGQSASDSNDGLSSQAPLETVAKAAGKINANGAGDYEIIVQGATAEKDEIVIGNGKAAIHVTMIGTIIETDKADPVENVSSSALRVASSSAIIKRSVSDGSDKSTYLGNLFTVSSNAVLTLGDSTETSSELCIDGGSITSVTGSLVHVDAGGEFNMYTNVTLCNNLWEGKNSYGGAVYNDGTFHMYGGKIYGNRAEYGSAVYNPSGTLQIKNGLIYHNKCYNGTIMNFGNAQISGGIIENNIAQIEGGGIENQGNLEITGTKIWNNKAGRGGGIYNAYGKLALSDITITDNSSGYGGDAIYNENEGKLCMSGDISIPSGEYSNDVRTDEIYMNGLLNCKEPIMITQNVYKKGSRFLIGSTSDVAAAVSCFKLKDDRYCINSSGILEYIVEPITYYVGGTGANPDNDGKSSAAPFENLMQAAKANNGGTCIIVIQGDSSLSSEILLNGDITIKNKGKSHTISVGKNSKIEVGTGVLNLGNTNNDNTGLGRLVIKPVPESNDSPCLAIDRGAVVNMYSETNVTGWNSSLYLIHNTGTLNVYGGCLTGNTCKAVISNWYQLNMTGGEISNNSGNGILNFADCNISGGKLANNHKGEISNSSEEQQIATLSLSKGAEISSTSVPYAIRLSGWGSSVNVAGNIDENMHYKITSKFTSDEDEDNYYNDLTVLTGDADLIKTNYKHFSLANKNYEMNESGKMICKSVPKTYYVGSVGHDPASDENTGTDSVHPFKTIQKALKEIGNGIGTIIIQSDITLEEQIFNKGNVTIVSDKTKHTITSNIKIPWSNNDMIYNIGNLTLGNTDNSGRDDSPELIFDGNQACKKTRGAAVLRNAGIVNIYSGVSLKNGYYEEPYGTGGINNFGTCYMYGGIVCNNVGFDGGGVFNQENSTFIMNGGFIRNNTGSGVYEAPKSSFIMNGGSISDNTSNGAEPISGVVVEPIGSFIMNGGIISGNSADSAGLIVFDQDRYDLKTVIKLNGGSISGNKGTHTGVFIVGDQVDFSMSSDIVINNGDRIYLVLRDKKYAAIQIEKALTETPEKFSLVFTKNCKSIHEYNNIEEDYPVGTQVLASSLDYTFTKQDVAKFKLSNQNYAINCKGYYSKAIKENWVNISGDGNFTEDGNAKTVAVNVSDGKKQLTVGTDYTVSYRNNIHAGIATINVTGIGNYGGTISKTFTIKVAPVSPAPTTTPTPVTPVPTTVPVENSSDSGAVITTVPKPTKAPVSATLNIDMAVAVSVHTDNNGRHTISLSKDELEKQLRGKKITDVNLNVTENSNYKDLILENDIINAAVEKGVDLSVSVKDSNGKERYRWQFDSANLKEAKNTIKDMNLHLDITPIENWHNFPEMRKGTMGFVVNFAQEGKLPAQASVKIYVGNQKGVKPGDQIYLYHWNKATGKLETLPYSSNYVVDQDGYIDINIVHCSDYVVLTRPADKSVVSSLRDQITVAANHKVLSMNKKNNKEKLKIGLPATLRIVKSLKEKPMQNVVGGVTVTYSSGNKKVAKVSKNGVITATGKGRTTITTILTLYSGKKKKVRFSITVKESKR